MKIIHCADLHFDSKLETNLSRQKALMRRKELITSFENMVNFAQQNGVQAIIVAGDMFDKNKVTEATVSTVASIISAAQGVDFLVLSGNHDNVNPFETLNILPQNLFFFSDEWKSYDYGNVTIAGICLNEKNSSVAAPSLSLDADRYNIVVLHGDIQNDINLPSLRGKNIDYLALGHIHQNSEGKIDERGSYAYSGCLESRGFDESGVKGFYLLDTDEKTRVFVSGHAVRTMHLIEIDITGLSQYAEVKAAADKAISNLNVKDSDMVKIVLKGSFDVDANVDAPQLAAYLEQRFFFSKVKNLSRAEINAEDYKNDVSLKGEFVRQTLAADLSEDEKREIILCGIRAIRGEEIEL